MPAHNLHRIAERGGKVVAGYYEAYGFDWRRLPDTAMEWRTHPVSGYEFQPRSWWTIEHLPRDADIKDVWEPGRFAWVYDLVRRWAAIRDPACAEAFHTRLMSWLEANQPYRGVQWSCGQETAIRALAILHAMDSLPPATSQPAASRDRILAVLGMSGERIADAIGYGLSQRNNHGISEAAGLIHIGLRLANRHPEATRWVRTGCRLIEEQIQDQFYADGWYAQHSFTYMRVALEQAILAQRALCAVQLTLSSTSLERLGASYRLLLCVVNCANGHVPNHGANDGARIVPYSTAEYRDFRPTLTLAALVLGLPLPADITPDAEVVAWLGSGVPAIGPPRADGVWSGESGWAAIRLGSTQVFLWAGRYRHRPSHLDALHVDVSFGHEAAVVDPGTFAYNAPPPWRNALSGARVHNGPVLDGAEPGRRGPRFLWYSWPSARIRNATLCGDRAQVLAELDGRVLRAVEVRADGVSVRDSVLDPAVSTMQVSWLLDPCSRNVQLAVEGAEVERTVAAEGDILGWFSPTYGLRQRSRAVTARARRSGETLEIVTSIFRSRETATLDGPPGFADTMSG
jgi:hypothetical protein